MVVIYLTHHQLRLRPFSVMVKTPHPGNPSDHDWILTLHTIISLKCRIQQGPLIQHSIYGKHPSWNMERMYHGKMPRTSTKLLILYNLGRHSGKYIRCPINVHILQALHQTGWQKHTTFVLVIHDLFYTISYHLQSSRVEPILCHISSSMVMVDVSGQILCLPTGHGNRR